MKQNNKWNYVNWVQTNLQVLDQYKLNTIAAKKKNHQITTSSWPGDNIFDSYQETSQGNV